MNARVTTVVMYVMVTAAEPIKHAMTLVIHVYVTAIMKLRAMDNAVRLIKHVIAIICVNVKMEVSCHIVVSVYFII